MVSENPVCLRGTRNATLVDVTTIDEEVKIVIEVPGISKDKIMITELKSKAKILKENTIALLKYHLKQI
jgi:HSP20 family molecular chaperone IbpA